MMWYLILDKHRGRAGLIMYLINSSISNITSCQSSCQICLYPKICGRYIKKNDTPFKADEHEQDFRMLVNWLVWRKRIYAPPFLSVLKSGVKQTAASSKTWRGTCETPQLFVYCATNVATRVQRFGFQELQTPTSDAEWCSHVSLICVCFTLSAPEQLSNTTCVLAFAN